MKLFVEMTDEEYTELKELKASKEKREEFISKKDFENMSIITFLETHNYKRKCITKGYYDPFSNSAISKIEYEKDDVTLVLSLKENKN